jgi:syntaxin 1B/2/3
LQSSNRYGESRAAYREVQERHEDIKKIERTLGELAQLFNDVCGHEFMNSCRYWSKSQMSILVEQQDETIDVIQTAALSVEKDTEVGWVALR